VVVTCAREQAREPSPLAPLERPRIDSDASGRSPDQSRVRIAAGPSERAVGRPAGCLRDDHRTDHRHPIVVMIALVRAPMIALIRAPMEEPDLNLSNIGVKRKRSTLRPGWYESSSGPPRGC
jgi:hypothetical protein